MYYDTVLYCACAGSSEYARCRLDVAVERLQERRVKILGRKVGGWVGKSVRGVRGCGQHRGDWNTGEAWVVGEKKRGSRDFPHRILDKRAGRGGPGHFLNTRVFLIPIDVLAKCVIILSSRKTGNIQSGMTTNARSAFTWAEVDPSGTVAHVVALPRAAPIIPLAGSYFHQRHMSYIHTVRAC